MTYDNFEIFFLFFKISVDLCGVADKLSPLGYANDNAVAVVRGSQERKEFSVLTKILQKLNFWLDGEKKTS